MEKESASIPRIEFRNVSICYEEEVVLDDELRRLARRVEVDAWNTNVR